MLRIPAYLWMKGGQIFSDLGFFSALVLRTNWCTTICITCPILREIECSKFVWNEFVIVLVEINLMQFEHSNRIRSICTKFDTNSLHTNLLHSILPKNRTILRKIGHVIKNGSTPICTQNERQKNFRLKKNQFSFTPRYAGIHRISTKEKKIDPLLTLCTQKTRRINTRDLQKHD
jgi:hypothetical protein